MFAAKSAITYTPFIPCYLIIEDIALLFAKILYFPLSTQLHQFDFCNMNCFIPEHSCMPVRH